ncbi:MAG: nitrate reductase [Humidesulfovibrio sp.]|uniref:nitrate reductase n=1 Tax=Humidesulfovibrio sp. TaxID=2910988 RepID=UPI002737061E|nr:nitrate reductase [Humidesulfovibrio sp.]MDP2847133.1 nitrate reductase [Humidesulfovibrio sp.]
MFALYDLAAGPLFAFSLSVFVLGMGWRVLRFLLLAKRADPAALKGFRLVWAIKSIFRWLVPANITARENPLPTVAGFVFHLGLLATALFLQAHVILWDQAWDISWWTLPDEVADYLAFACLGAGAYLILRRLAAPQVRALTGPSDWLVLFLSLAPVLSGVLAYHQWGDYDTIIALHVLAADLLLLIAPFTKLSHVVLFFVSRAVTGSDFGKRNVGAW